MSAWLVGAVLDLRSIISLARALALSFLVGGFSAYAYLRTVTRDMPSSGEMARRESPFSLPFWIAFHPAS